MKRFQIYIIALLSVLAIASCSSRQEGEKAEAGDAIQTDSLAKTGYQYKLDPTASTIEWTGKKPTGEHTGTLSISEGTIEVLDGTITGGKFKLDMNSIVDLDLKDKKMNDKLIGHLKSEDFFDVGKFPFAEFEITGVEALSAPAEANKQPSDVAPTHNISGNLKIKDISKSISFKAVINVTETTIEAKAPLFYIDRAEWNIKYKSKKFFDQLKDDFIHDEIGIIISLKATK